MIPNTDEPLKMVVAWDGSRASASTFPLASIIGAQLGAQVEILHVTAREASPADALQSVREVGLDGLEHASLRIEAGDAVQRILAAAAEPGVALVVLTTHVTSIAEGRHLGGVAQAVVRGARSPLLLVRPEAPPVRGELRRLLLPLDSTPKTAAALQPAFDLAKRLGASVDLLYVAAPGGAPDQRGSIGAPRYVDQPQHEWPAWAAEVIDRLARCCAHCPPEVPVRMFLAQGNIAAEIEQFAGEHASDAIVLVRRSQLQTGRARTLRSVMERAPSPVLVLSGPEA